MKKQWFELKLKLIDYRWVIIPVFLACFYLFVILNFYSEIKDANYQWNADLAFLLGWIPYHIVFFIMAIGTYLIGWFMKNRIISSLYFLIMIAGFISLPIYYPYQFIIGGVILVGIIKIKKPIQISTSEE